MIFQIPVLAIAFHQWSEKYSLPYHQLVLEVFNLTGMCGSTDKTFATCPVILGRCRTVMVCPL